MSQDDFLERWEETEGLLDELLELPLEDRRARVRDVCAANPRLRPLLEPLVTDDVELSFPVAPANLIASAMADPVMSDVELLPDHVGPFDVLGELGRGGMARVFLGRRAGDAIGPRVALKVLDSRQCTGAGVRRFERERQTLARLQHPNIASFHDVGVTSEGVPYLVMELVEGLPLDQYCDRECLDVRSRLALFLQVCAAVDYAHGCKVVHRDLKPANVFATADGRVKLLDFGIAKWLETLDAADVLTRTRQRVLTLSYAAPEQLRGQPVTPATDVYQLGLLLYELLTGRRPFESRDGPDALRRALDSEPGRPSRAVLKQGDVRFGLATAPADSPDAARRRGTSVTDLARTLAGDLDAIVLKALRSEPGARYPTVAALGTDIDSHLAHRPVSATRGARWYMVRKYVGRRVSALTSTWRRHWQG